MLNQLIAYLSPTSTGPTPPRGSMADEIAELRAQLDAIASRLDQHLAELNVLSAGLHRTGREL